MYHLFFQVLKMQIGFLTLCRRYLQSACMNPSSQIHIMEDIKDMNHVHFSKSWKIWFRWEGYHEPSQYFASVSLCVCSESCVKVLHRNFGWTNRDQESRIQKRSLAIVSLSQWQHLSRHSHSQCSAWSLWISQSEDSRLYNPGYLAKKTFDANYLCQVWLVDNLQIPVSWHVIIQQ